MCSKFNFFLINFKICEGFFVWKGLVLILEMINYSHIEQSSFYLLPYVIIYLIFGISAVSELNSLFHYFYKVRKYIKLVKSLKLKMCKP